MDSEVKKSLLISLHFPPDFGGEQTYYYNICKNLPGDKIIALAPTHPRSKHFDDSQHFTIFRHNIVNKFSKGLIGKILAPLNTAKWISQINYIDKLVKRHGIEIIQAGQVLPIGTLAMMYKNRHKVPYIFYAHGLDIMLPQQNSRKKALIKKIIKGAQNIVANSHFTKDELVKLGADPDKILVVYPCPNVSVRESSEDRMAQIAKEYSLEDKKILLTISRLVTRKGHDKVIEALPQIIKKVPNTVYVIAGTGPNQKNLEKLAVKYKVKDYVRFLGKVPTADLPELYEMSDIFIMPNRIVNNYDVEGFGIVFIEAGLFGKPVIGGNNGGVPEAIIDEQTGLLVDPTNINEITSKTIKLLTNEQYGAKLGIQGQHRASEEFNWEVQTDQIKKILT